MQCRTCCARTSSSRWRTLCSTSCLVASLSYLGLGVQPPTPEWGAIVADGQNFLLNAWWITTLTGLVIVIVGVGLSLIGDGLAERMGERFRLTV